jgi:hypothetical protein
MQYGQERGEVEPGGRRKRARRPLDQPLLVCGLEPYVVDPAHGHLRRCASCGSISVNATLGTVCRREPPNSRAKVRLPLDSCGFDDREPTAVPPDVEPGAAPALLCSQAGAAVGDCRGRDHPETLATQLNEVGEAVAVQTDVGETRQGQEGGSWVEAPSSSSRARAARNGAALTEDRAL